ncbi:MAG: septal ring lytic transglycosylase RlpA family protein [Proteobacteria bacterium]|nr:septal ring lytic transglycosylase RlpA family protein [Pseudomonadota bacterium]
MIKFSTISRIVICSLATLLGLTACSTVPVQTQPKLTKKDGPPPGPVDVSQLQNAVPKYEPKCRYGNPSVYTAEGKQYYVLASAKGYSKVGIASWYGTKFHGKLTSSHEPYNMLAMTAASPTLPLPTYVRVTNLENGRQVIVKVNDRGPFANDRIMDLSYAAAKKLGYAEKGTAKVKVDAITFNGPNDSGRIMLANNSQPVPSASRQLYVQVGAFYQMAQAEQVKSKVSELTHLAARIQSITLNEKTVYRVQIGPLKNLPNTNLVEMLQQKGFNKPITIYA